MQESDSKQFEEDHNFISQAKHPSEYSILKHDQNEVPVLPINPNLLFFKDKALQTRYHQVLYLKDDLLSLSKEFSYSLLTFYIFLTFYLMIVLSVVLSLSFSNQIVSSHLVFHLSMLGFITFYAYGLLFCIKKYAKVVYYNKTLFFILGNIVYLYMIIGNSQVLSGITNDKHETNKVPLTIGIIAFTYIYRRVLFDSYKHVLFTLLPALLVFLLLNLVYSNENLYSILGEFAVMGLSLFLSIIDSQNVENQTIQLFYRLEREKELSLFDYDLSKPNSISPRGASTESLVQKCDFIIKEIKYATSIIMYKDVKARLKNLQNELSVIKNFVGKIEKDEKFEIQAQDIDEQDKLFIYQNYLTFPILLQRFESTTNNYTYITTIKLTSSFSTTLKNETSEYLSKIGSE